MKVIKKLKFYENDNASHVKKLKNIGAKHHYLLKKILSKN